MKIQAYIGFILIAFSLLSSAQAQSTAITFGESNILHSNILQEDRKINIYLPEDYNPADSIKYPVIYILDGGVYEDFFHLASLIRFNSQAWVARVPASIVVGIENTNRRRDFTFPVSNTDFIEKEGFQKSSFPQYGGSELYIQFLEKELFPFIKSHYAVNEHKSLIGESLAGLLASEILLKKPSLFNRYTIVSPSLWWGEQALIKDAKSLLTQNLHQPIQLYFAIPSQKEDEKMYQEAVAFYEILKSNSKINSFFDYLPEESHATIIHQAVSNSFRNFKY